MVFSLAGSHKIYNPGFLATILRSQFSKNLKIKNIYIYMK
jgi:hypothetical protein